MPITPFLNGQPFLPETLHNMSAAFEAVCDKLGLVIKHDPATEQIAKFIVQLAQTGVHDFETLLQTTLTEFNFGR